jgi:hypothetical protein
LQAEALTDKSLKRALGPVNLTALGIGAIIGAGIFVLTGQAAAQYAGPAIVYFLRAGRAGLRVRRPVLRGICGDDSHVRLGLHLRLRHARRIRRVDHRLGFDSRISVRRLDRGRRLVGLCRFVFEGVGHRHPGRVHSAPYDHVAPPDAPWWNIWRLFTDGWVSTGAC